MRQAEKVDLGSDDWTMEIRPYASAFHFPIKELWEYRDLLFLFVRRDFKTMYKQTILGPAWYKAMQHPQKRIPRSVLIWQREQPRCKTV